MDISEKVYEYWKIIKCNNIRTSGKTRLKNILNKCFSSSEVSLNSLKTFFKEIRGYYNLTPEEDKFFVELSTIINDTWLYIYKDFPQFTESLSSIFSITIMIGFHALFYPVFSGHCLKSFSEKCAIFVLLYAYVDYFLDDPDISLQQKKEFMKYIPIRIKSNLYINSLFPKFNLIMSKFENFYDRKVNYKTYDALMYAYNIEVKSVKMQYEKYSIEEHEHLMIEKGISTMLLYLYMDCDNPSKEIYDTCIGNVSIIGQLTDDLMDLKKDMREKRDTAITLSIKESKNLDMYYCKLEFIFNSYIEDLIKLNIKDLKFLIKFMENIKDDYINIVAEYNKDYLSKSFYETVKKRITIRNTRETLRKWRKDIDLQKIVNEWKKLNGCKD